jgi:altronate dehydratase
MADVTSSASPTVTSTAARRLIYRITPRDNVATALVEIAPGATLDVDDDAGTGTGTGGATRQVVARAAIPFGHKIAVAAIAAGEPVVKYGEVIGLATAQIAPGDHVHTHNVESQRGRGDLARR